MAKSLVLSLMLLFSYMTMHGQDTESSNTETLTGSNMNCTNPQSEEEWKKTLTPEQYRILREKGTEMAFTGKFYDHHEDGVYICAACGAELFSSDTKYESGSGWPSFFKPIDTSAIGETLDKSHGMVRTEIVCSKCGGHLGHVFNDGPQPTGMRYCVNSVSLDFKKEKDK